MTIYVDSSALVAVYVTERFSAVARAAVRAAGPVPFTALHQLEVSNAFELLVGRELMTRLDLLHVAAAHVVGCTTFVSADDPLAVAKASALTTIDIKRGAAARSRR